MLTPENRQRSTLQLKCEYEYQPIGIDSLHPRFSWIQSVSHRDQMQKAYRIRVSTSAEGLLANRADVWDTGKIISSENSNITFTGEALKSATPYFWKVQVWDNREEVCGAEDSEESIESEINYFITGLFDEEDWMGAEWISRLSSDQWRSHWDERERRLVESFENVNHFYQTSRLEELFAFEPKPDPSPLFRKRFSIQKPIAHAYLYTVGLGFGETYLNGSKVTDNLMENSMMEFDKRVMYSSYEVTDYLNDGDNMVGIWLGRGWYNPLAVDDWNFSKAQWIDQPKLRLMLRLLFADGSVQHVVSDTSWHAKASPIVWDDPRSGEIYDARLEDAGWSTVAVEANDGEWSRVYPAKAPEGLLGARRVQPERAVRAMRPVSMQELSPGTYLYDFGQAFSGWARLKAEGDRGTQVTMSWSDDLRKETNSPFQYRHGSVRYQQHIYILKGQGTEIYEPRFAYHAGRYLLLEGYPGSPDLSTVEGRWVRTDMESAGSFVCSDPLINALQNALTWTIGSLVHGYPQDCPHREKNGWLDYSSYGLDITAYNFDSPRLFESWAKDIRSAQEPSGHINVYIPHAQGCWGEEIVDPTWGSAVMLVPWMMYTHYGDTRLLEEQYDTMVRYYDYYRSKCQVENHPGLVNGMFADWLPPGPETHLYDAELYPTPPFPPEGAVLVSSVYHYRMTEILAKTANLLGKTEDRNRFEKQLASIQNDMNSELFDSNTGIYRTDLEAGFRQTSQVLPLKFDLVPEAERETVLRNLMHHLIVDKQCHLDTGTIGSTYLLDVLAEGGQADTAYRILTQRTYPGWGYFISQGQSSIPEHWSSKSGQSFIHSCFIGVGAYLYKYIAGIQTDLHEPGFRKIRIKPYVDGDLQMAEAYTDSIRGRIHVRWEKEETGITLRATIPANATARISVPVRGIEDVEIAESDRLVWKNGAYLHGAEGIRHAEQDNDYITFTTGSGIYHFTSCRIQS